MQDSRRRRKLREKLVSQRKKAAQFGWQSLQSGGEGQAINKVRREFPVYTSRAGSLFPGPWSGVSDNRGQLSWAFLCEWQRGGVGEELPVSSSPSSLFRSMSSLGDQGLWKTMESSEAPSVCLPVFEPPCSEVVAL